MASDYAHPVEASLSPELIAHQGFASSRRGFDPEEVRAFLNRVAAEIRAMHQRQAALEAALREAEHRAAHPTWDQDTLMSAVGEETAAILRSAHAAAADIRGKAEENASRILNEAQEQAGAMRGDAETVLGRRTEEAEAAAARIREAAEAEGERLLDQARQHAESLRERADVERKALVDAAQVTRERILADLTRKRKVAMVQIEQLRAGRERLLESYRVVRRTLDEVTSELARADSEARAAAEAAGRLPVAAEASAGPEAPPASESPASESPASESPASESPASESPASESPGSESPGSESATSQARAGAGVTTGTEGWDGGAGSDGPSGAPAASVENLFARIRADREEAVAKAREVLSDPRETPPSRDEEEQPLPDADEALLQRRDAAINSIEAAMSRKLKRALQDEQNDLLDRLRNVRGRPTAAAVLPDRPQHTARFVDAAGPLLDQAARAGTDFVSSMLGTPPPDRGELPGRNELAGNLAGAIVDPLRRRLEEVIGAGGDTDPAALAESVGAAYREWKTQRIELVACDHVAGAFARGAFAGTPAAATLRWLVEDVDGPCPDCDDNALAGEQPKGEPFPTGQRHPPAHAGCRCLIVPKLGSGQDGR